MKITLDIETVPSEDPAVREELAAGITPPANYSKPETIAKWEAESKPALVDEALLKTAFDGSLGRIVCIGFAIDDEPAQCLTGDEADIIARFYATLVNAGANAVKELQVIGHNISGFDLRFLWQRSVIHGIQPPWRLLAAMHAKPWDKCLLDTMTLWHPLNKIKFDRLCRILGVPSPKTDMDGSKVYAAWKAGEIERIAEYCRGDVEAVRECERRIGFRNSRDAA